MKMLKKLLLGVLALTVVSCSGTQEPMKNEILPNGENLYVNTVIDNTVYLNLTSIGLYDGTKGSLIADSNIEFGYTLTNISAGDNLPGKSVITSTSADVTFKTWCYYGGEGILTYATKVVEGVSIYQAVFEYNGNYDFKPVTPTSTVNPTSTIEPTSTVVPTPSSTTSTTVVPPSSSSVEEEADIVRYYFIDQSWWNDAAAESWIYIWNSVSNEPMAEWPGECMNHVEYNAETGRNLWYFDIDLNLYDRAIISRRSGDGLGADWGAQTVDIELNKDFNTMTLIETASWGNTATVTTSLETY